MTVSIHDASVPVFARYLRQLGAMLALAQQHAMHRRLDPDTLLQARLSPSMYPLARQVEIAASFALRTCAPLAAVEEPAFGEVVPTFPGLQTRIEHALQFIESLSPQQMLASERATVKSQAGQESLALSGRDFLLLYALPNFFFHVTTAYAILRHMGVGLGKADFDGFHVYAEARPRLPTV